MVPLNPAEATPLPCARGFELRLGVHDRSRIEWILWAPLPPRGEAEYQLEVTLELPPGTHGAQLAWEQLETYARLASPGTEAPGDPDQVDRVRRSALGVAHRIKQQRGRFERACQAAASELAEAMHPSLEPKLRGLVDQAAEWVAELRRLFASSGQEAATEVAAERALADEFLSHQLLDLLAAAERALDGTLLGPGSRLHELGLSFPEHLRVHLAETMAHELEHRRSRGLGAPHAESREQLARFVARASELKKHFHELLYLDAETWMVDSRARTSFGIVAASFAAGWGLAFALLMPGSRAARLGIGLGSLAVLCAAAFALRHRLRELLGGWLAGRRVRLSGQRAVRLRLPMRVDPHRPTLVDLRERIEQHVVVAVDPPGGGLDPPRRVVRLCYGLSATARVPAPAVGAETVKHVFRYDLSPVFGRLDDAVKRVPVLDESARRVRFADAPREYPVRLTLRAVAGAEVVEAAGTLILSKDGIGRMERTDRAAG